MTSTVTQVATSHLVGPETWTEVPTTWIYHRDDPFAVRVAFGDPACGSTTTWMLARDLLRAGMSRPTGHGDIRLWPSRSGVGPMFLHLRSPAGEALIELPREPVKMFLEATQAVVPFGSEPSDFDDELRALTGGEPA